MLLDGSIPLTCLVAALRLHADPRFPAARIKEEEMVKRPFVPLDGTEPIESREFPALDDYPDVVGGWIESVDVPSLGGMINGIEEGLIRQLPLNIRATFLWWLDVLTARQKTMLVGDPVLVGTLDGKGESTDGPSAVIGLTAPDRLWSPPLAS